MYSILVRNAAKCKNCQQVLESTHDHDYQRCICGKVSIDGGFTHASFSGDFADMENLCEWITAPNIKECEAFDAYLNACIAFFEKAHEWKVDLTKQMTIMSTINENVNAELATMDGLHQNWSAKRIRNLTQFFIAVDDHDADQVVRLTSAAFFCQALYRAIKHKVKAFKEIGLIQPEELDLLYAMTDNEVMHWKMTSELQRKLDRQLAKASKLLSSSFERPIRNDLESL